MDNKQTIEYDKETGIYEPIKGEKILVVMVVDYPSYSFLFGIPKRCSPRYKKEAGFIEYKDRRKGRKGFAVYLDVQEIQEFMKGLKLIKKMGKKYSNLWGI